MRTDDQKKDEQRVRNQKDKNFKMLMFTLQDDQILVISTMLVTHLSSVFLLVVNRTFKSHKYQNLVTNNGNTRQIYAADVEVPPVWLNSAEFAHTEV